MFTLFTFFACSSSTLCLRCSHGRSNQTHPLPPPIDVARARAVVQGPDSRARLRAAARRGHAARAAARHAVSQRPRPVRPVRPRYAHPFEADGAVTAIRFDERRAAAPRASRRPPASSRSAPPASCCTASRAPWLRRVANVLRGRQKNTANTSVMMWQDRLFALMEGAQADRARTRRPRASSARPTSA